MKFISFNKMEFGTWSHFIYLFVWIKTFPCLSIINVALSSFAPHDQLIFLAIWHSECKLQTHIFVNICLIGADIRSVKQCDNNEFSQIRFLCVLLIKSICYFETNSTKHFRLIYCLHQNIIESKVSITKFQCI